LQMLIATETARAEWSERTPTRTATVQVRQVVITQIVPYPVTVVVPGDTVYVPAPTYDLPIVPMPTALPTRTPEVLQTTEEFSSPSPTWTATLTPTASPTPSATPTATETATEAPSSTFTPTHTPTTTPTPSATPTATETGEF
jgi:hypothetical protein